MAPLDAFPAMIDTQSVTSATTDRQDGSCGYEISLYSTAVRVHH